MSPEAQRIAIAKSVGIHLHDGDHAPSNYTFVTDLPDFLMGELVKPLQLTFRQSYLNGLILSEAIPTDRLISHLN